MSIETKSWKNLDRTVKYYWRGFLYLVIVLAVLLPIQIFDKVWLTYLLLGGMTASGTRIWVGAARLLQCRCPKCSKRFFLSAEDMFIGMLGVRSRCAFCNVERGARFGDVPDGEQERTPQ
jgi:hypothetical protein